MNKLENYNPPIDMKWTNVWQPPTVFKSEHLGIDDENGIRIRNIQTRFDDVGGH
jgi:hypothetical protein